MIFSSLNLVTGFYYITGKYFFYLKKAMHDSGCRIRQTEDGRQESGNRMEDARYMMHD